MSQVLAISLGSVTIVDHQGKRVETGIFKTPLEGGARVGLQGFDGDVQVDRKNHGGPDKAVYVYTRENHLYWANQKGAPEYPPGHFGENLTVTGLPDAEVHIGDILAIGETLMQVTQPRVPCFKLGIKFGDPGFVGEFLISGRTGFYLRILREGWIHPGDGIQRMSEHPAHITVAAAMRALIPGPEQHDWMRKIIAIDALSAAWRQDIGRRLESNNPSNLTQEPT